MISLLKLDNDTRGWILTSISGLACVLGALFICVDLVVRQIPRYRNFKIQDSNGFLSCSLSLSAGVMLFSALYKLLPSAKDSLSKEHSPRNAAWILIGCFLAGVWGIQIISRVLHRFMPTHTVDCDHAHDDDEAEDVEDGRSRTWSKTRQGSFGASTETSPLLARPRSFDAHSVATPMTEMSETNRLLTRPSLQTRMSRTVTRLMSGEKMACDVNGSCRGYTSPCGIDCFKNITARGGTRAPSRSASLVGRPTLLRPAASNTRLSQYETLDPGTWQPRSDVPDSGEVQSHDMTNSVSSLPPNQHTLTNGTGQPRSTSSSTSSSPRSSSAPPRRQHIDPSKHQPHTHDSLERHNHDHDHEDLQKQRSHLQQQHHHHVPKNAFLSLSFQTSVAIVLHKLPEGFITYASNHANPKLGFNIFMALAIHNLTEGFCLALPIYLATNSRLKALAYSFVLGGFSQPLGAGIVAIWLKIAESRKDGYTPSDAIYGCLFAITAGILANVALNLLSQSFELSHNKGLCMFFVFAGMGILGISSALNA